ncbi:MAG: NusG domain II-containing protein [Oscillospiraceae bacterium]|nr:NusG domain II-containing protein [Oscillospiraceae bacterium]
MRSVFRKKDIVIIAALLFTALAAFLLPKLFRPHGAEASVIYDGTEIMRISLDSDGIYTAQGDLLATFEVSGGRIRFVNSLCPDKLCEGFGWISLKGETAVCMPAKLALIIV